MIKGIIFDMDGVIIESESIYMEAEKDLFKKYGLKLNKEEREKYTGVPLDEIWQEINRNYNIEDKYDLEDIILDHVDSFYSGLKNSNVKMIAGLENWLKNLKKLDIKMIIASSSFPKIINYIYYRFTLGNYMEGFIDLANIENGKPDPEIFIEAAKSLDLKPDQCLVIEDSENGVKAAKNAGMKCVAFNGRNSTFQNLDKADLIIEEYSESNFSKIFGLFS